MVLEVGPQLELVLPLIHGNTVGDEAQYALLDARSRCNANKRLASTTGQHYDACIPTHPVRV